MSEVSREQEYIGRLYERVDVLRGQASARLALALRQDGGTAQSRLDRDAAIAGHAGQLARLDAAEDGLCFGPPGPADRGVPAYRADRPAG